MNWLRGEKGEWYVIGQFILFGIILVTPFLTRQWSGWPAPAGTLGLILGLLLGGIGMLLGLAGLFNLGRNLVVVPYPKEDGEMVAHGAYRVVRHPIYSGLIFGAFGWALLWNSLLTLLPAVALFILFDFKSRREEQWLVEKYPEYPAYQQRVRKLVPFIY